MANLKHPIRIQTIDGRDRTTVISEKEVCHPYNEKIDDCKKCGSTFGCSIQFCDSREKTDYKPYEMPERLLVTCWNCGHGYYMLCADSVLPEKPKLPDEPRLVGSGEVGVDKEEAVKKLKKWSEALV
jgi:hypothetical protein